VLHPITRDDRSPLELYEAINAVQIAEAAGADQYAAESMANAKQDLQNAQSMDIHQKEMKQENHLRARGGADGGGFATDYDPQDQGGDDAAERARIEGARRQAQDQAQQSALAAQQAQDQQAQAERRRRRRNSRRMRAQQQAQQAQAAAAQARAQQTAAEQAAAQAAQQTLEMREKLRQQLNTVLQTQETARRADCEYVRRSVSHSTNTS